MSENNFKELENRKIEKYGEASEKIIENIESNMNVYKSIADTVDLFTDKLIQVFIKINN